LKQVLNAFDACLKAELEKSIRVFHFPVAQARSVTLVCTGFTNYHLLSVCVCVCECVCVCVLVLVLGPQVLG